MFKHPAYLLNGTQELGSTWFGVAGNMESGAGPRAFRGLSRAPARSPSPCGARGRAGPAEPSPGRKGRPSKGEARSALLLTEDGEGAWGWPPPTGLGAQPARVRGWHLSAPRALVAGPVASGCTSSGVGSVPGPAPQDRAGLGGV